MILLQKIGDGLGEIAKGLETAEDSMKALKSANHLLVGFMIIVFAALIVVYLRGEKKDKALMDKESKDNEMREKDLRQRYEQTAAISQLTEKISTLIAKLETWIQTKR